MCFSILCSLRSFSVNLFARGLHTRTQRRREGGGARGTCPSEIASLKNSSPNSMEFVTFNQIVSIFFGFLAALPRLHPGLCTCMDNAGDVTHSSVPFRNKFLATPLHALLSFTLALATLSVSVTLYSCFDKRWMWLWALSGSQFLWGLPIV